MAVVRRPGQTCSGTGHVLIGPIALAGTHLPNNNAPIQATGGQILSIWRPGNVECCAPTSHMCSKTTTIIAGLGMLNGLLKEPLDAHKAITVSIARYKAGLWTFCCEGDCIQLAV